MNPELRFRLGFGGEALVEFGAREHGTAMSAVAAAVPPGLLD